MSYLDTCQPGDYITSQKWLVAELGLRSVRQQDFALYNRDGERAVEFAREYLRLGRDIKGWGRWQFAEIVIESLHELFAEQEDAADRVESFVRELVADEVIREQLTTELASALQIWDREDGDLLFCRYYRGLLEE